MSTKTTFKRIALVAVAALGLGVLSVAPSQATITGLAISGVTAGSAGNSSENSSLVYTDSTTAAKFTLSGYLDGADSITASIVLKSVPVGGTTSAKFLNLDSNTPTANGNYQVWSGTSGTQALLKAAAPAASNTENTAFVIGGAKTSYFSHNFGVQLESAAASRVAGTYVFTVVVSAKDGLGGGAIQTLTQDVSIVVAKTAAATSSADTTIAPAKSTAFIGTTSGATSDAAITAVSTASSTAVGVISVRTYNADSVAQPESITATISGAGLLSFGGISGSSLTIAGTGTSDISVLANGTAGVATINVSTTSATFAPKTVTFYAKAAKTLTAAVNNPVLRVGSNTQAVVVSAVDANGTNWAGKAYIVASAAADALVGGSATTPVACEYNSTYKVHYCPVTTIATGTAKFKVIDASTVALATATSNEVTVTVSNAAANSIKVAFDKATYAPFEKALIWVTVLDKDGKPLQGNTYANLYATGGITSNLAFTSGSASDLTTVSATTSEYTLASSNLYAGAKTYVVYMPAQGDVTISVTGGTSLAAAGQIAYTATASVVNSSVDAATDAANEATDAANAATDAALAAADAADAATAAAQDASDAVAALSATVAKLVASLKAQITSLTNLVIKIQKKVKA